MYKYLIKLKILNNMGDMFLFYPEKPAIMLVKTEWVATTQQRNALCQQAGLDLQ